MPGPQNIVVGDDFGVDIPVTSVDETQMAAEQKAAKYSRSHEFKKLEAHWDATIERYQRFLPDGRPVDTENISLEELGRQWLVANQIIKELMNVKNYYETSRETVAKSDGSV